MARNRDCQAANYAKRGLITARRAAAMRGREGCCVHRQGRADRDVLRCALLSDLTRLALTARLV